MTRTGPEEGHLAPFLCSRCGGALSVREGSRLGRCSHCGTSFLARFPGDEARFVLPPALDDRRAGERVRELLRGKDLPRDLPRKAVLQAADLFFVPYWRIQATVVGRLRGTRTVRRKGFAGGQDAEGAHFSLYGASQEITRTEEVDRPIRKIWGATLSACPVDDLGIPTLSPLRQRSSGMLVTRKMGGLPGARFLGADIFRMGKVLDVMVTRESARKSAETLFQRFIETRGFGVEGKEMRYVRLQERSYLLYYPIHRVRFRYGGRIYQVVLDAYQGQLIHAHLPTSPRHSLGVLQAATLLAALLCAAPLRLAVFPPAELSSLAGLGSEPGFWGAAALVGAGLFGAARYALAHFQFTTEKVLHG